jgi:DNA replication and repair protein RecF
MVVKSINLDSFRNLDSAHLDFDKNINIFCGKNGSGKTNLLEAIFVLLLSRSTRGAAHANMINDKSDYYRLEGIIEDADNQIKLESAYQKNGRKKIVINGATSRAGDLYELCSAVSASPPDIEILSGSPSRRREFINIYLSQASMTYLGNLTDYQKALAQKNAFLRMNNDSLGTPYNDLLVKYGSVITQNRAEFLSEIGGLAEGYYRNIANGQSLKINYKPSVTGNSELSDIKFIESEFRKKLDDSLRREAILQTAVVGPHRDEIEISINDFPARTHGSQGELRSAALSLKLAVLEYLTSIRKTLPVLLLDEIFAELDSERFRLLAGLFERFGQIFLTTAREIPETLIDRARIFNIENGTVTVQ